MKPAIYEQHDAAFKHVSAFVVVAKGERVATVAIKFPRDGAGRLYAYVHWIGVEMKRGYAGGYGYDKRTAAVRDACRRIEWPISSGVLGCAEFAAAIDGSDGEDWSNALRKAGFDVWEAV